MTGAAILLAGLEGGCDEAHPLYANDLAMWRSLLVARFDVPAERIRVLSFEGGTIATLHPSSALSSEPASRSHLSDAFDEIGQTLDERSPFFFVVSNHGDPDPPRIVLAHRTWVGVADLAAMATRVRSTRQAFIFGQCGAGCFLELATDHRAVLAGGLPGQRTYGRKDDPHGRTWQWTQFLYDLAAALGGDPDVPASASDLASAFAIAEASAPRRKTGDDGAWPQVRDPGGVAAKLVARTSVGGVNR